MSSTATRSTLSVVRAHPFTSLHRSRAVSSLIWSLSSSPSDSLYSLRTSSDALNSPRHASRSPAYQQQTRNMGIKFNRGPRNAARRIVRTEERKMDPEDMSEMAKLEQMELVAKRETLYKKFGYDVWDSPLDTLGACHHLIAYEI
jgi:hypothetical protein